MNLSLPFVAQSMWCVRMSIGHRQVVQLEPQFDELFRNTFASHYTVLGDKSADILWWSNVNRIVMLAVSLEVKTQLFLLVVKTRSKVQYLLLRLHGS